MGNSSQRFFYQIKGAMPNPVFPEEFNWGLVDAGYVEAIDRDEARKKLETETGYELCLRSRRKDIGGKNLFYLRLYDENPKWDAYWNEEHLCECCGQPFTALTRNQMHGFQYIRSGYCSKECEHLDYENRESQKLLKRMEGLADGVHKPVIYRIFHKLTDKNYIGQTTQAFTLRWYQHFFQKNDTKFHRALKDSRLSDWGFEVIEVLENKKDLSEREQYWIDQYDSIENGFNSVSSVKSDDKNENQLELTLEQDKA